MTVASHIVAPENTQRIAEWLETRGGLAVWQSIGLTLTEDIRAV